MPRAYGARLMTAIGARRPPGETACPEVSRLRHVHHHHHPPGLTCLLEFGRRNRPDLGLQGIDRPWCERCEPVGTCVLESHKINLVIPEGRSGQHVRLSSLSPTSAVVSVLLGLDLSLAYFHVPHGAVVQVRMQQTLQAWAPIGVGEAICIWNVARAAAVQFDCSAAR
jgi:hypothetical protein